MMTDFEFGAGKMVIETGSVGGRPAVFIDKAVTPGPVGSSAAREPIASDGLKPDTCVLFFPTAEQAKRVADALVNALPPASSGAGGEPDAKEARARRAIDSLREPVAAFARVPNTLRQSLAEVIEDLLASVDTWKTIATNEYGENEVRREWIEAHVCTPDPAPAAAVADAEPSGLVVLRAFDAGNVALKKRRKPSSPSGDMMEIARAIVRALAANAQKGGEK